MTQEEFFYQCIDVIEHWLNGKRKLSDLREVTDKLYNEVTKPHWISVEDELPKEHFKDSSSKWVLVCTPLGSVYIDSYNHKKKEWVNNRKSVTHWMPLPSVEHLKEESNDK